MLMLYTFSKTAVIKVKILLTLKVMQFLYKLVLLWRHAIVKNHNSDYFCFHRSLFTE